MSDFREIMMRILGPHRVAHTWPAVSGAELEQEASIDGWSVNDVASFPLGVWR